MNLRKLLEKLQNSRSVLLKLSGRLAWKILRLKQTFATLLDNCYKKMSVAAFS